MTTKQDYAARVTYRAASEEDYDFLYQMHVATMKDYVDLTWGWVESDQQSYFRQNFDPAGLQIIVVDGQDAGMLSIEHQTDEVFLRAIELLPAYQGGGIGTYIIRSILEEARQAGKPVLLYVLKVNPVYNLYQRLGFETVQESASHKIMRVPVKSNETRP